MAESQRLASLCAEDYLIDSLIHSHSLEIFMSTPTIISHTVVTITVSSISDTGEIVKDYIHTEQLPPAPINTYQWFLALVGSLTRMKETVNGY